ncbi:hypothetical protein ASF41_17925 [Methylobacterium sp. Leaf111]|uniref:hypothetical protein n=1 Tax=Methylobacterium sp. Leaf111 TaxID=1736257 RepID=UPI0006FE47BA|nr:hypothetical protein [Methylobacterium sp. Leaf111]KQP73759.1 hypothetical protein ASF41_17925 [Methylobacterium sp. Leaf111]
MRHRHLTAALAIALGLSASGALAQSYTAPAGIPAAVAPAGLEGRAAAHNLNALRRSHGQPVAQRHLTDDLTTGSVRAPRTDRW